MDRHRPILRKVAALAISFAALAAVHDELSPSRSLYKRFMGSITGSDSNKSTLRRSLEVYNGKGTSSQGKKVTLLMGIFSTHQEVGRRQLIRDTELSYGNDPRICSLQSYVRLKDSGQSAWSDCQVVYTFVVGNNDSGPTERLGGPEPLAVDPSTVPNAEPDVSYLNIKENMEDGKSPTWFKYASTFTKKYGLDYVAKADSDTLLSMKHLFEFIDENLPPTPAAPKPDNRRMYGGIMVDNKLCGGLDKPRCQKLVGRVYAAGQFYFMSSDLVEWVAQERLDRERMHIRIEDLDMGTIVFSNPKPVKFVALSGSVFWRHEPRTKTDEGWKELWHRWRGAPEPYSLRYPKALMKEGN